MVDISYWSVWEREWILSPSESFALDIAAVSVLPVNILLRNLTDGVAISCLIVNSFASYRDSRDLDYI